MRFSLVVGLVVVSLAVTLAQHCETPRVFEGKLIYSDPSKGWGISSHHVQDGKEERVSIYEEINDYHQQEREYLHRIWHYRTGYEYRIDLHKQNCSYHKIDHKFRPIEIPRTAEKQRELFVGTSAFPGGYVEVGFYTDSFYTPQVAHWQGEFTALMTGCLPIREWYEDQSVGIIYSGWYNLVLGINDPNVFTPPSDCQPADTVASRPPWAHFD
jgi:hypothetical protein